MKPTPSTPSSTSFPTPVVVVSRCLGFEACRYNGEGIPDDFVEKLKAHVKFVTVCPEIQIGLGVPRDPIHLEAHRDRLRLVQPSTGADLTAEMLSFSDAFLSSLKEVDGFILKSRSPSCGLKDVKLRRAGGGPSLGRSAGMFGGAVLEKFPHLAVEDEARLTNRRIRKNFLVRVFVSARFRQIKKSLAARRGAGLPDGTGALRSLVGFHSAHKLLSTVFNPHELSRIRNIAAKPFPAELE